MAISLESKRAARRSSRPLDGRTALVTGGGRGIGRGISAELLRAGARVVIGDIDEAEMVRTCRELSTEGSIDWVNLDVSSDDSVQAGMAKIALKHGPVDILVNNAGIASAGMFAEEKLSLICKALDVDLGGPLRLTRLALTHMIAAGWGRIVNISSMMAFTGSPGFAVYSAAKSGLVGFGEAIERELRYVGGIRVTTVLPPSVQTRAFEEAKRKHAEMMRWRFVPPVSVERVARRTVRGLIAGRKRVYCSAQSYLASLLQRLCPWAMDWILTFMYRAPAPPRPRLPSPEAQLPAPHA